MEGATARERDLIEAGLSEPAGGGLGLWGLCQRRWVRDGALAETGDAFCGLNAASVSELRLVDRDGRCGHELDRRGCGAASDRARADDRSVPFWRDRPARSERAVELVGPQDVSSQKEGRGAAGRGRTASLTMTPPQPGQRSGWRGGTVSSIGSAAAGGRLSRLRQTASLSARWPLARKP